MTASQGKDQSAARRLVSNVHHSISVHRSVSFRPKHQTRTRREELMRISLTMKNLRGRRYARSPGRRDTFGTPARQRRDERGTGARQQKAAKNTHTDQCTVGAGPLRGARVPRAEGVRRRSAKEAQKFPYLFAPSPVRLEGRSGNGSRSKPAERPAARRAVSYP